jgi:hypothetical protein
MNLKKYYILLFTPFLIAGIISNVFDIAITKIFMWLILLWVPPLRYFRMKYLGLTLKDMFVSLIPFYGAKIRSRILFDKRK